MRAFLQLLLVWAVSLSFNVLAEPADLAPFSEDLSLSTALNYDGDGEGVELISVAPFTDEADLKKPNYVMLWKIIGPTYWASLLGVAQKEGPHWRLLARINLGNTEAVLKGLNGNLVTLDTKVLGPNDPLCCPGERQTQSFQYQGQKLSKASPP